MFLNVVFAQNISQKDVDATKKIIKEHIQKVKTGELNGCQLRFELPRSQQKSIPKLFAELENKRESLRIESFGLSVNALEEAFLKVAGLQEISSRQAEKKVFKDVSTLELHKDLLARILQQLRYIWLKRFIDLLHNIPLIVNQIFLPIAMAFLIGWTIGRKSETAAGVASEHHRVSDMSLNRIKSGRFLIFDPHYNAEKRIPIEKAMKKYPHIQIISHHSEDWYELWPKEFPWAVLGVIIQKKEKIDQGHKAYFWLLPPYLYYKELTLYHFISDVELAAGELQMQVSFTRLIPDNVSMVVKVLSPFLVFVAAVLLNASFITSLIEERVSIFRHQLFLAGLSPLVFWVATIFWDFCVIVIIIGVITLVMNIFKIAVTWMFIVDTYADVPQVSSLPISAKSETYGTFALHCAIFWIILIVYEFHFERFLLRSICEKTYIEKSDVPDGSDIVEERERVKNNISNFALAVQDLTKYHGATCAVKKTTYGVQTEDCFGLVGASGAGKTTTFDVITGLRFANNGRVFIGNQFVNRTQGIGYCPQFDALLPRLTCEQNMMVIAALIGYKNPKKVVDEMLRFLGLTKHGNKAVYRCSGGQRRRVGIGVALMNPSKLVILDEPTAGIDPKTRHDIWGLLKKMRLSGKAIVLSSHSMEECEALCSRIGVLVKGRLVAIGASQALKTRHADNFFLHVTLNSIADRGHVVNTVLTTFPSGILVTKREDAIALKFKIRQRKEDKVSELYAKAEAMASSLPLKEFTLIQASLEDVLEILNEEYSGKAL
ncbi:hypothetical protein Aduo_007860 [Ancylostoma duodenale]